MRSRFWGNATGVRGRGVGFRPTVEAKNTITTTDCDTFEGANSTVVTDDTATRWLSIGVCRRIPRRVGLLLLYRKRGSNDSRDITAPQVLWDTVRMRSRFNGQRVMYVCGAHKSHSTFDRLFALAQRRRVFSLDDKLVSFYKPNVSRIQGGGMRARDSHVNNPDRYPV